MAAPKIIAAPSRGAYVVKGTPGGITIPKAPTAGMAVTGKKGTEWVYRLKGPGGVGWYAKKPDTSKTDAQKAGIMANSFAPAATTTSSSTAAATPGPVAPPAGWWQTMFAADPRLTSANYNMPVQQNQVGAAYGFYVNRDPATKQALYRRPQTDASGAVVKDAQGNVVYEATGITQTYDPQKGTPVYRDASGKEYDPATLEMDIKRVARGDAGYLEGAMGSAEAQSANRQYQIGNESAKAGAGRSGMRASTAIGETAALQSALSGLGTKAAGELAGIDREYANTLNDIYQSLVDKAGEYVPPADAASGSEGAAGVTPVGGEGTSGVAAPAASATVERPALSGGADGEFLREVRGIGGQREMDRSEKIRRLRALASSYTLTRQQQKYLETYLQKNYGVGMAPKMSAGLDSARAESAPKPESKSKPKAGSKSKAKGKK